MTAPLSARSEATTRRTYNRPLNPDDPDTKFETWEQTIERAQVGHHRRLWEDAGGEADEEELAELRGLGLDRSGLVAGRTLWLGGTEYAYCRAGSQFNCSATDLETIYDLVDAFWLLLNGCGVGGKPKAGVLHGYNGHIPEVKTVPSTNPKEFKGPEGNAEVLPVEANDYTWTITVGDSARAWCKALGKLLASPRSYTRRLVLDFSRLRGPGGRLKGYGWICNGYEPLAEAFLAVHEILNRNAWNLLDEEAITDIFNWLGTVLSSRRAAECAVLDSHHHLREEFSHRKKDHYLCASCGHWDTSGGRCKLCGGRPRNQQRRQSNNSILFWQKPTRRTIEELLEFNLVGGEPGFVNAAAALRKCPWFKYFNPCYEIMLGTVCNLVSVSIPHFDRDFRRLERAVHLMARANYRQTCVSLDDGILQARWHQTNEAQRLCGVSLTGITQADWLSDYQIRRLRDTAVYGAYGMADELGLPRPKAVTTVKPEGTRSKISGRVGKEIAEGMHRPLGRFVFNWINFSTRDPLVGALESAGYTTLLSPSDPNNMLVRFPVEFGGTKFDRVEGKEVNLEPAVDQLERYLRWNTLWADHNVSATISFSREEIPAMAEWLHRHWDHGYIATAFMARVDPTKTARDLGHPYLPQEVVTEEAYREATAGLRAVDWDRFHVGMFELDEQGCSGGVCPIK